jgi:hypothetical protein
MDEQPGVVAEQTVWLYESPEITEVGAFGAVTEGQYSKPHSDDGDAGGYWSP